MTDSAISPVSGSTSSRPEVPPPHARRHPRLNRARVAAVTAANRLAADVMPRVPDYAKRFMARAVTIDGSTLDPTMQLMLASLKLSGEDGVSAADDPELCRKNMRDLSQLLDRKRLPVGAVTDLRIPGPAGDIPARHYRPADEELGPLLMFFHGGGYVIGDLDTADNACRMICRGAGIHVLSIDYRLAPEHPAPAAVDDCYAAYRWALEHGSRLGTWPGVVAVGGDSAGGALSAVVSRLGRDDGVPPAFQMLLYPWTDQGGGTPSRALFGRGFLLTQRDLDWFRGHYLGRSEVEIGDPRVSPLLAADLSGLPRALVITAGFDPPARRGRSVRRCDAASGRDGRPSEDVHARSRFHQPVAARRGQRVRDGGDRVRIARAPVLRLRAQARDFLAGSLTAWRTNPNAMTSRQRTAVATS